MVKIFITISFLFILSGCTAKVNTVDEYESTVISPKKITINNITIDVDLAITKNEQATGLAGRSVLADDYGLLFVFDDKKNRNFWMKGMLIPIDIIWIDGDQIVNITAKAPLTPVGESHKLYSPKLPVDKVLEVRAGLAEENKWVIGDKIEFLDF